MLSKYIRVGGSERSLLIGNGELCTILTPGEYCFVYTRNVYLETETHDIREIIFQSRWAKVIATEKPQLRERHFTCVATSETQVGIIYADGQMLTALTPAKQLLAWRGVAIVTAELVDVINSSEVPHGAFIGC